VKEKRTRNDIKYICIVKSSISLCFVCLSTNLVACDCLFKKNERCFVIL